MRDNETLFQEVEEVEQLVMQVLKNQAGQLEMLKAILAQVGPPEEEAEFITFSVEGKEITMLTMTDSQQSTVTLVIKDAKGKPAKVDGVPTWKIDDATVATVTPAADGMSALVVAGNAGAATITVDADADLGPGVTDITGVLSVVVTSGQATVVELQAGPPVEQP